MTEPTRDELTGKLTTGHEWDGIRELNNPLPKWWLVVLYVTIIWSFGYWVFYPAWPYITGYTKGVIGYDSHKQLKSRQQEAAVAQELWIQRIKAADTAGILSDSSLVAFAQAGGRALFNENCAPCHAVGGAGRPGFPVLADDDWIWGGKLEDIEFTIRHGIRTPGAEQARSSGMPNFGADQLLDNAQRNDVVEYVLSLSNRSTDAQAASRGQAVFAEQCVACHGDTGAGRLDVGGPNLTDDIWLFGQDKKSILAQMFRPRHGVMPTWQGRLSDEQIKMLTVYVHSLGGGQ